MNTILYIVPGGTVAQSRTGSRQPTPNAIPNDGALIDFFAYHHHGATQPDADGRLGVQQPLGPTINTRL